MDDETMELVVLGINIGNASGWDQMDTVVFFFYDPVLKPEYHCKVNSELDYDGVQFDYYNGTVEFFNQGDEIAKMKIIDFLS